MVGKVLASNLAGLSPGDFVSAYKGWQTHALVRAGEFKKIPADEAHRASAYLGRQACCRWLSAGREGAHVGALP